MNLCKWWRDQPDGFHGWCYHPDVKQPPETCILNTEDTCILFEEVAGPCDELRCEDRADAGLCDECQLQPCDLRGDDDS